MQSAAIKIQRLFYIGPSMMRNMTRSLQTQPMHLQPPSSQIKSCNPTDYTRNTKASK